MKLKATEESIFTYNTIDKEFKSILEIKKNRKFLGKYTLGKICKHSKNYEEIKIIFIPNTINKLKYLYHVKQLGPGLKFKHLAYVKATSFQALRLWINLKLYSWLQNIENWFKILTIVTAFTTIYIGYTSSNKPQNIIINNKEIIDYYKSINDTITINNKNNSAEDKQDQKVANVP